MLSEHDSFPVSPLGGTVENCRQNVEERADIFVLIIGNRYGSVSDDGVSITNLEFLQAKAKGIPVYVFVDRRILGLWSVWQENPEAKFSEVDSPRLFEFVDSLHKPRDNWIYQFDTAEDITGTLRKQWSYLFLESLHIWTLTNGLRTKDSLRRLSGNALRLIIEKPRFWEYRLFSQVLVDKLADLAGRRRDQRLGLAFGKYERIDLQLIPSWVEGHINEIIHKMTMINNIFQPSVQEEVFGEPGTPGDPERIVWLAERVSDFYSDFLDWSLRSLRVQIDEECRPVFEVVAQLVGNAIAEVESFVKEIKLATDHLVENPPVAGETRCISVCLKLTVDGTLPEKFHQEMERLTPLIVRAGAAGFGQ